MPNAPQENNSLVLSYLELRTSIGVIGILLPFVVSLGKILLESPGILGSISSYYYSVMGGVFVGSLCAIGVFLWSYRGYDMRDSIAGHLAAIFAIGVALFPTAPDMGATAKQITVGYVHLAFAAALFLTFAYFALVLFRKTNTPNPTRMKRIRNIVYAVCGYAILICIALLVVLRFVPTDSPLFMYSPIFWLESLIILVFGASWFVKGEAILKDE
jgi:hypothetical protein